MRGFPSAAGLLAFGLVTACSERPTDRASPSRADGGDEAGRGPGPDAAADAATAGPRREGLLGHRVVASYFPRAAELGFAVLEGGGNATDAFVTTALADWVLAPGYTTFAGNFGAMVFDPATGDVLHLDGEYDRPIDPDGAFHAGDPPGKTVAVFGSMAALAELHARFGSRPWAALVEPAAALAGQGFELDATYAWLIENRREVLERSAYGRATFFPRGEPLRQGETLVLPEVASFLRAIADQGVDYMYRGDWAARCVAEVQAQGGVLTAEDLDRYRALWHEPWVTEIERHEILGSAGRFTGGLFAQLGLAALEHATLDPDRVHYSESAGDLELLVRLTRRLYRESWLYDAAGLDDLDGVRQRLSAAYAREIMQSVQAEIEAADRRSSHSSSLAVLDETGHAVVATHSINALAWSEGIFVQGIVLDGGAQWALWDGGPGERRGTPLAQHMVFEGGRFRAAASTFGSSLMEASLQLLLDVVHYRLDAEDAADRPRFGTYSYDPTTGAADTDLNQLDPRVSDEIVEALAARGLRFERDRFADTGLGSLIVVSQDGALSAANLATPVGAGLVRIE